MEEEFDDDLDELCSQVPINICSEKSPKQNENVFKKPKYSFNRVQQNRTFNPCQSTQQSNALKSQTYQQNRFNQIAGQTGPNKTNQSHGPQNKTANKPLNAQPLNQRQDSRPTSSNANNQPKSNTFVKPNQTAAFGRPNPPLSFSTTVQHPGNAPFSNLNKSIVAQNKSKDCHYSINKQFIAPSPKRQIKPVPGHTFKPTQSTSCNQRIHHGVRSESSNSTIRSTQSAGFSQFQGKAFAIQLTPND